MKFDAKQRFLKAIVRSANLEEATPHILKLSVCFAEVILGRFTCYIFRQRGSKYKWTPEDYAVLKRLYPTAERGRVLEALPTRTWQVIVVQAAAMKVGRMTEANVSGIPENLTWLDAELLKSLELPVKPLDEPHLVITKLSCSEGDSPHTSLSA